MTYIDYKERHKIRKSIRIERATKRKELMESLTFNFQLIVTFMFLFMLGYWWCTGSTFIEW